MAYEIEIKELPAQPAVVVRFTAHVSEMGEPLGRAFGATMQHIEATGAGIAGPPFAYYEQLGNGHFDVRAGFPVQTSVPGAGEVEAFEVTAGLVATTRHVGSYSKLSEAYEALGRHAVAAGYDVDEQGPSWEQYLSPPETPPEQTQTLVYMPVRKT